MLGGVGGNVLVLVWFRGVVVFFWFFLWLVGYCY